MRRDDPVHWTVREDGVGFWSVFKHKECRQVLDTLQQEGIRLALISNWDSNLQTILDELDISRYFDVCSISAVVGWRKPHAKIFTHTLDELGLDAIGNCVH